MTYSHTLAEGWTGVDLALDTGIFLAYAHEAAYESCHEDCAILFRSPVHLRFMSASVEKELAGRVRQRINLYHALITHVSTGGKVAEFDLSPWNSSDTSLGLRIVRGIAHAKPVNLVTHLRLERERFDMRLEGAVRSLQPQKIPASPNLVLEAALRTLLDEGDATNVCEYLCWASTRRMSCFVSIDGHLLSKRDQVLEVGKEYLYLTDPPWAIQHASTVV